MRDPNGSRYRPGDPKGFYESYFLRANHPRRPLAFWIRYTLFAPAGRPEAAVGELWAVVFDGDSGRHVAVKTEVAFSRCAFGAGSLDVTVGEAVLGPAGLTGAAASGADRIAWDLAYAGTQRPLLLFDERLYDAPLPRAKSLVPLPLARFEGTVTVNDTTLDVAGWVGSQNHNWGTRHTDRYAWGQVAGFDDHPDTFLELATAQLKLGPMWTPHLTPLVLRHGGREIALNTLGRMARAYGRFGYFDWQFRSGDDEVEVEGFMLAPDSAFVGLRYGNPPGGHKHCLNTKIATCEVRLTEKRDGTVTELTTRHRAAFEILTDDASHGIALRV